MAGTRGLKTPPGSAAAGAVVVVGAAAVVAVVPVQESSLQLKKLGQSRIHSAP